MKNVRLILSAVFFFCLFTLDASIRRHIIVLQDNSGSYFNSHNASAINQQETNIVNLFEGKFFPSDYSLYKKEIGNNIPFFNPETDKVSFFWFVAGQKDNCKFYHSSGSYIDFENYFLVPGSTPEYKPNEDITVFLRDNFNNRPTILGEDFPKPGWMKTYSFTAFSYPLCLDAINSDYASEYLIIIVSDFKAGSTFGNKLDQKIFQEAFHGMRHNDVIERVNRLSSHFFKVDYLDNNINVGIAGNMIGFTSFKIKPNVGDPVVESADLRVNSNILFEQELYGGDSFKMSESSIVFGHNKDLSVDQILLTVEDVGGRRILSKDISSFATFDTLQHIYRFSSIPQLSFSKIDFGGEKKSFVGDVKYIFNTRYHLSDSKTIKYKFEVDRTVNINDFIFQTQLSNLEFALMIFAGLFVFALIIYAILHLQGAPVGLILHWNRFNDNYESVDFSSNGNGRIHTDYAKWISKYDQNGIVIPVSVWLDYKHVKRFYNWREQTGYNVTLIPQELSAPQGFSLFVTADSKVTTDSSMPIEVTTCEDGVYKFNVVLKKLTNVQISDPVRIAVRVEAICHTSGFLRKFYYTEEMNYEFHIGQDLGQVWIGVDPGTTGSCIATATSSQDMLIEQRGGEDYIAPSVISINPNNINKGTEDEIRENTLFGGKANAIKDGKRKKFVSIKKLLGYNKEFELKSGINVKSSFLSTLLIEGLFQQNKDFIEKDEIKLRYSQFLNNGIFAPNRAVFAIPNNFTAAKIQQLKECISNVKGNSLKEVRFIYEAEAILINYINSKSSKTKSQTSDLGETVFIFDMGGATINATLANIKCRKRGNDNVYFIDILAKLGYGIGGDTIDYAFLKWIFSKSDDYPVLAQNNPFLASANVSMDDRRKLKDEALNLKISTIRHFKDSDQTELLDRLDITKFNGYNLAPFFDGELDDDPFTKDLRKNSSNFLSSEFFKEYVWDNVISITKDIMTICSSKDLTSLDTVIMSGRSSHFPRISEFVKDTIKKAGFAPIIYQMPLVESKSAVAKGACYYGIQNANFILKNRTINGAFGVVQTIGVGQNTMFHRLIGDGASFDENGLVSGSKSITKCQDFSWDGRTVRFCQVMGVNPEEVIAKNQKHKYTEVAAILADPYAVDSVRMDISEKDKLYCYVKDVNGNVNQPVETMVNDADIMTSNDEQYTFFIAQS